MVKIYAANVQNLPDPKDNLWIIEGLPDERKNKILRYVQAKDRKQSLGASLLLKKILEQHGYDISQITYGLQGKPELSGIYFNVSHSDDYVICAISNMPVGCDIQKIGKPRDKMAERYFTENEVAYLNRFDDDKRNEEFYRIWTMKESYVKMTGEGLSLGINRIEFKFENEEAGQSKISIHLDGKKQNASIKEYDLSGYKLTVCAEESVFIPDVEKIEL